MVEGENEQGEIEEAKFNMAIETLKDLSRNLQEQRLVSINPNLNLAEKQTQKINLVKYFFIRSSPLLPKEIVEKYKEEILHLKPAINKVMKGISLGESKFIGWKNVYSESLEFRLDEIMVELQQVLQEQKYFMPPKEEEGMFG